MNNTENTPFKTKKTFRILKEADSRIMEWAYKAYGLLMGAIFLLACAILMGFLCNIAGARQINYVLGPLAILFTIAVAFTPSIIVRLLGFGFFVGIPADGDAVAFAERILRKFTGITLRVTWGVTMIFGLLCFDLRDIAWLFWAIVTISIILILVNINTPAGTKLPLWQRVAKTSITMAVAFLLFNAFINAYGSQLMSWSGVDVAGFLQHSSEQKKSYDAMHAYNERKNRSCITKFVDPATGKPFATADAFTTFMATKAQFDNRDMEVCLSQLNEGSARLMNRDHSLIDGAKNLKKNTHIRMPWSGPELFYSVTYAPKDHPVGGMVVEVPEGDTKPYTIQCSGQYTQLFADDQSVVSVGCGGHAGAKLEYRYVQEMPIPNARLHGAVLVNGNLIHSDKYIGKFVGININVPQQTHGYIYTNGNITLNFFR